MSVRACACCFSVNPIEKRKEKGAREIVKWGRTQKKKGLCRRELIHEDLFFVPFGPSFFLPFFHFLFSPQSAANAQCPNAKQKTKRHKIKRRKENSTAKIRKIISYVTRIGDWIHFENSQRDDTTIRKDVRITQWPRRTPH